MVKAQCGTNGFQAESRILRLLIQICSSPLAPSANEKPATAAHWTTGLVGEKRTQVALIYSDALHKVERPDSETDLLDSDTMWSDSETRRSDSET